MHSTFQFAAGDAQNLRVGSFVLNGSTYEYLVYGDAASGTHIIEFNSSGTEIASITDTSGVSAGVVLTQVENFGDGRVGIVYNEPAGSNGTSQYDTQIYDLRTAGINVTPSSLNNYIAGTEFNDTVHGASGNPNLSTPTYAENFYDYIGQNASGQVSGDTGPSDVFYGGATNAWNEAIFAGTRADYSIAAAQSGNGYVINYINADEAHAGSLTVDQNVEALAFSPTLDPQAHGAGAVEASGSGLTLLTTFTSNASIDAGATLEFYQAANSAVVTFNGSTGTLQLDDAPAFTDQIAGFSGDGTLAGSDHIDLTDINFNSIHFSDNFNSATDILSVTDGTNTANLQFIGSYEQANFKFASDGRGGTIVYDPPVPNQQSAVAQATADTFVFQPGMGNQVVANFSNQSGVADKIELDHFSIQADQLMSLLQSANGGHDTIISLGHGDSVTLTGVEVTKLHVTDFILH